MKRLSRAAALAAPIAAVIIWFAVSSESPPSSYWSNTAAGDTSFDEGRTRELPANGPVAAPSGGNEFVLPADRAREMMPHLEPSLFERARSVRAQ